MVPSNNSSLGITIANEVKYKGKVYKNRIAHIYALDSLIYILQLLNKTVDPDTIEKHYQEDLSWLYMEPIEEEENTFCNIIHLTQSGKKKILGVIYLTKYQSSILSAIKHSINKKESGL